MMTFLSLTPMVVLLGFAFHPSLQLPSKQASSSSCGLNFKHVKTYEQFELADSTMQEQAPWQVAVMQREWGWSLASTESKGEGYERQAIDSFRCAGVLVSDRVVLTSADCFPQGNDSPPQAYNIVAGAWDRSTAFNPSIGELVGVAQVVVHPDAGSEDRANDLAIVFLDRSVKRAADGSLTPVCIGPDEVKEPVRNWCHSMGWSNEPPTPAGAVVSRVFLSDEHNTADFKGMSSPQKQKYNAAPLVCHVDGIGWRLQGILPIDQDPSAAGGKILYTRVPPLYNWIQQEMAKFVNASEAPLGR